MGILGVALVALRPTTVPDAAPSATTVFVAVSAPVEATASLVPHVDTADSSTPMERSTTSLSSGRLEVVAEGLQAWGRFAVDGDLEKVRPWFDPAGPQFERFRTEAQRGGGVGGEPYAVMLREATETLADDTAKVSGRVVFARTGEPSQVFNWTFELVRTGDSWMIWTVGPAADE